MLELGLCYLTFSCFISNPIVLGVSVHCLEDFQSNKLIAIMSRLIRVFTPSINSHRRASFVHSI